MAVIRIRVRRVAKCSALMFGVLVVLAFVNDSLFFFKSTSSSSVAKRIGPLGRLQDLSGLKENSLETHSRFHGDQQHMQRQGVEVGVGVGVAKEESQLRPTAVSSSYPPVYDWWEDLGVKYFRGERLPDDMLAVVSRSVSLCIFFIYFILFYFILCCPNGIFPPWEIRVAFPVESQLRQSRATQPEIITSLVYAILCVTMHTTGCEVYSFFSFYDR